MKKQNSYKKKRNFENKRNFATDDKGHSFSSKRKLQEKILEISEGILSTVTDIALWELFYLTEVGASFNSRGAWTANYKADRWLNEINYETIKRALVGLKKRGLVSYQGQRKSALPEITAEGKRRLEEILPHYDKKRLWDGKIYLVTYDIPETKKHDRELLRESLKRIGAGMVQESVWLTPYDPRGSLKETLKTYNLEGLVLISVLEKNSSIGDEDLLDLIKRVYKLDNLNARYEDFLEEFSFGKHQSSESHFSFLSILRDDPQLPFVLLPSAWVGDKAYQLFIQQSRHAVAH